MSQHLEELMVGYVLKTLSSEEMEEMKRLLEDTPELQAKMSQLEEIMALLAYCAPEVKAPAHLREKIVKITRPTKSRLRNMGRELVIAALTIVTIGLGVHNYSLQQKMASRQAPETQLFALKSPNNKALVGSILLDLDAGKALIDVRNLPELPKNKFYQLWAVTGKKTVPCGQLTVKGEHFVDKISIPLKEYEGLIASMFITIESSPHPLQPSTDIVISS